MADRVFQAFKDQLLGRGFSFRYPPEKYVIKIVDLGGYLRCVMSGQYVSGFDVEAVEGLGLVVSEPNPLRALMFETVDDARACYETRSKLRPLRFDGGENRPMTRFRVEFEWIRLTVNGVVTGPAS